MSQSKKTPTPRYIAAKTALSVLSGLDQLTADAYSETFDSRISQQKLAKINEQLGRFVNKLKTRLRKAVDGFENPNKPKGKPPGAKKADETLA